MPTNPLLGLLTILVKILLVSATVGIGYRLIRFELHEWREARRIRQEKMCR